MYVRNENGLYMPGVQLGTTSIEDEERGGRPRDPFGIDALVGPKGSGKSLLAHHRAWHYAQGMVVNDDGSCICNRPDECDGKWEVYSNLKSTNKGAPEAKRFGGGWTEPLEVAVQILGHQAYHAVLVTDEGYQLMDNRRSMLRSAIELVDEFTQGRKGFVVTMVTGLSIDWLDTRIRSQLRASYNCWTPNKGRTTLAVYTEHALGHLPPWERAKRRGEVRKWDTAASRELYDTHERVMDRSQMEAQRKQHLAMNGERGYWRLDEKTGVPEIVPIGVLITEALSESLYKPEYDGRVAAGYIEEYCSKLDAPVTRDEIDHALGELMRFPQEADGRYHVGMIAA